MTWHRREVLLKTSWELGEYFVNIVGTHHTQQKSKTPHFPKREKRIWDKSVVLLGTSWELGKHVGNMLGTHCEQQKSKKSKTSQLPPPPNDME